MDIFVEIKNRVATLLESIVIICGNDDYVVNFLFDEEWGKYPVKTLRLTKQSLKSQEIEEILFTDNKVSLPVLYDIDKIKFEVFVGDLRTSSKIEIECSNNGATIHEPPSKDIYIQLLEYLKGKQGNTYVVNANLSANLAAIGRTVQTEMYHDYAGNDVFECDSAWYFDSVIKANVGGREFVKTNANPAIGCVIHIGNYSVPCFISPDSEAVLFTPYNTSPGTSVEFNGLTWYSSTTGYALNGRLDDANGVLPTYPVDVSGEGVALTEESVIDILKYVGARKTRGAT